jgi:Translation initiation factor eIF3 subunit 135
LTCLRDVFPVDHYTPESSGTRTSGQENIVSNPLNKLRSEFVAIYQTPLSSDALTPASGASRREKELNDEEVMKASRFLRENWIPAFVRSLDLMEVRPFDSASLTTEMHLKGINMRYLGFICKTCTIPFVRSLALVEMIARVCKSIYQNKIRGAILHFRTVGATAIEDQMNQYTANLFSTILGFTERTAHLIDSKIRPEVKRKFDFNLTNKDYLDISRPALFLALQYHCGITFENHTEYNFMEELPISKSKVISFEPRVKTLTGTHASISLENAIDDHKLAYIVARHFKSLGPKSKLLHLNSSASVLTYVSAHYNSTNRFEEARLYAQAAVASAQKNHTIFGLATAQLMYAVAGLQTTGLSGPEQSLLGWYGKAIGIIAWHWGSQNPLCMTLYDKMSSIYHRSKDPQKAFEFHNMSLKIADTTLGNNHTVTAGYLTRV